MPSRTNLPADTAAVVLAPSSETGGLALPGGCDLLHDCLFFLDSIGVSRAYIPGMDLRRDREPFGNGIELEAGIALEPAVASGLAGSAGPFLLVDAGILRRQDPSPLFRAIERGATAAIALSGSVSCGGRALQTSPEGIILETGRASDTTNSADSGMWLCAPGFPEQVPSCWGEGTEGLLKALLRSGNRLAAEFCPGYTRRPGTAIQYLAACGEILTGQADPWCRELQRIDGILVEPGACIPEETAIRGFLWATEGSSVGRGTTLENCVLLPGSKVGEGCSLRNALVPGGHSVRAGTSAADRTPKVLGRYKAG
jgi:hypothetical protein